MRNKTASEMAKRDCFAYNGGYFAYDGGCEILKEMLCDHKENCPFYKSAEEACKGEGGLT